MEITKEYFDLQLGLNRKYFDKQFEKLATKDELTELKADVTGMKGDITELKADVTGMKGDITELKADVLEIKTDIVALQDDVRDIKTDLSEVKEIVTNLNKRDIEDSNGFAKILVKHDLEIKRLKLKQA